MTDKRCIIGIHFGTLPGRVVLVDTADGTELAAAVYNYVNGVIDRHLPGSEATPSGDIDKLYDRYQNVYGQ